MTQSVKGLANESLDSEIWGYHDFDEGFGRAGPSKQGFTATGLELEFELDTSSAHCRDDYSCAIETLGREPFGDRYCHVEDDGSLDFGLEIVTNPATIESHEKALTNIFEHSDINYALDVESTCGLHIHVPKVITGIQRKFDYVEQARIMNIIDDRENDDIIRKISGRGPNTYAERSRVPQWDDGDRKLTGDRAADNRSVRTKLSRYDDHSKYRRCYLGHDETVEFRLFESSKDVQEILFRIEFSIAMVRFALSISPNTPIVQSWASFKNWALANNTQSKYGEEMVRLTNFIKQN